MTPWPKFDDFVYAEPRPTLASWLRLATEDLAATPRERITREIESHFAEAVEAYVSDGKTETEATTKALEDLGDPDAAAKRFKKSHLTEEEAKWLRSTIETASRPLFSILALKYDASFLAGATLLFGLALWVSQLSLLFAYVFVLYTGLRLVPRFYYSKVSDQDFRRLIGLTGGLTLVACGVIIGLFFIDFHKERHTWSQFFWFAYCALSGWFRNPGFSIWLKLRRMPDPWLNPPPQQAASA